MASNNAATRTHDFQAIAAVVHDLTDALRKLFPGRRGKLESFPDNYDYLRAAWKALDPLADNLDRLLAGDSHLDRAGLNEMLTRLYGGEPLVQAAMFRLCIVFYDRILATLYGFDRLLPKLCNRAFPETWSRFVARMTKPIQDAPGSVCMYEPDDFDELADAAKFLAEVTGNKPSDKPKQSALPPDKRRELILGELVERHGFDDSGGCTKTDPVKVRRLAEEMKKLGINRTDISRFFKTCFGSHAEYVACCNNPRRLHQKLEALRDESSSRVSYGLTPPSDRRRTDGRRARG